MIKIKEDDPFSLHYPVQIAMLLFIIIFLLRVIEVFVLRLDELWGEVFLTKFLGFLLIVAYLLLVKRKVQDIGYHANYLFPSLSIAIIIMAISLSFSYLAEWFYLVQRGFQPSLIIAPLSNALDSEYALRGGFLFGLWLIFGNTVNSLMEEGLFRGVMVTHFRMRLSFWKTNFIQAFLFGIWHIIWPLKAYLLEQMSIQEAIFASIGYIFSSGIIALVLGYLFLKTGNLWAPWLAHTINNTILNLVHTVSSEGYNPGFMVRMGVLPFIALLTLFLIQWMARYYQLPALKRWDG